MFAVRFCDRRAAAVVQTPTLDLPQIMFRVASARKRDLIRFAWRLGADVDELVIVQGGPRRLGDLMQLV